MECHVFNGILALRALLRDKKRLGLFMGLKVIREHAITYRDVCSISSLNERGTVTPLPPSHQGGAKGRRETLYWDSLPAFLNISDPKSYNCIQISYIKNTK